MTYEHSLIDIAHAHWDFTEDIIPLQFTGLTDRNGVEIYEGDLIHRHMNVFWKVCFKDGKWIADELKPISGLYLDASQFIEAEVIGNIYEGRTATPTGEDVG